MTSAGASEPTNMIVNLPDATTNDINKKIISLREEGGAVTMGRVLTLVIAPDSEDILEDSVEAANFASREHPCRVIAVLPGDRKAAEPRLDAEIRVGADAGAGEVVVLRLAGELADHASSVVLPFLLPDTPVVAWWPAGAPAGSRTGSVGPVGDSPDHRCHQQQRSAGGDQEPAAGLHARATPTWRGAASPTGVRCWRRRWTRRRSSRSNRRWSPA